MSAAQRLRAGCRRLAGAALGLAGAACGPTVEPPSWTRLAHGFEPRPLATRVQEWQRAAGLDPLRSRQGAPGLELELALARRDWSEGAEPGEWTARWPGGAFERGLRGFTRLEGGGRVWFEARSEPAPRGTFWVAEGEIELRLAPGEEPPADLRLLQHVEDGRRASDGTWQVRLESEYDAGFAVWSGGGEEVACTLAGAQRLTFELCYAAREPVGRATLRVRVDGALVFEHGEPAADLRAQRRPLSFVLPRGPRRAARIAFEAEGPPGLALVLHPVLGPAEVGTRTNRPWPDARADVVLFLADTLRADALASGGGPAGETPHLDALAERSVRFLDARSNAAWTLPSIATLLTGLAPGQHTTNDTDHALPGELTTVVERLSASGYRTVAVTDAAFFVPLRGLDQGFETFVAREPTRWDVDWTVERALASLALDDGRPVFLLVHTYRTHLPYRVGPGEDRSRWDALRADGCTPLKSMARKSRADWLAELAACGPRFRALYREGVRDLDRAFGRLAGGLEALGLRGRGYLLFTSDHGEALGENDEMFHGGALWEAKLRIPLLLEGPRLAPRDERVQVTLLDVAPTLAEIAGLAPDPLWLGSSLLAPPPARPALAFRLQSTTQAALVLDGRKLIARDPAGLVEGRVDSAFDLEDDPHEERPLADAAWAAELAQSQGALLRAALAPATSPLRISLSPEVAAEMQHLGYGGGDGGDD
jgi:arylsulfatase A-like enzyme